jgi:putative ABC transport system substrate-binding protein
LRELGYVEGQNLIAEHLSTAGRADRLPALASDLVRWKPDVIVVPNHTNALASREATRMIPIVAASLREEGGFIASLARPGGNVTGLTLFAPEMTGKQLELLKDIVPNVRRVALLRNPANPSAQALVDQAKAAARTLGLALQVLEARRPEEIDRAFAAMSRQRAGALLLFADAMFILHRYRIADLAAKAHLPVMYTLREHMGAAGLAFYGPSMADNFRRVVVEAASSSAVRRRLSVTRTGNGTGIEGIVSNRLTAARYGGRHRFP